MKKEAVVSSCLLGICTRYDGRSKKYDLGRLSEEYILIPMCPEQLGGLPTPREPAEIRSVNNRKRVIRLYSEEDVTDNFSDGARSVLEFCKKRGIETAIMKSKSPSCGEGGITHEMLSDNGIQIFIVN